jgi:hypothetical protein
MNRNNARLLGIAALGLSLASVDAAGQTAETLVSFSTGVEYSSGTYGGTYDLEDLYVPLTMRADYSRLGVRLTVPFVRVDFPVEVDPDGQPAQGDITTVTETGLGDIIGSATLYDAYVSRNGNFVADLTGKIKFATADEQKGLGTGENDYTFQVEAYRFFESFTLLGLAGYRLRGEPPGLELDDVFLASVGGSFRTSPRANLGLYYDYRQAALSGLDDIQEVSGYVSFRVNENWHMQFYAFTGFGNNSPEFGGGILVTTDLRSPRLSDRDGY